MATEITVNPSSYQYTPPSNSPNIKSQMMNRFRAILNDPSAGPELARVARFLVRINSVPVLTNKISILNDMLFLCDSSEFPGRGFSPLETRYYGPSFKTPGQSVYPDITMSFLCRNLFREREFFDAWQNQINPPNTYDFLYPSQYQTTIDIFQFDDRANCKYAFQLHKAYPINVNPQQVTWADDQFLRLAVQFVYTKWVPLGANNDNDPTLKPKPDYALASPSQPNRPAGGSI